MDEVLETKSSTRPVRTTYERGTYPRIRSVFTEAWNLETLCNISATRSVTQLFEMASVGNTMAKRNSSGSPNEFLVVWQLDCLRWPFRVLVSMSS